MASQALLELIIALKDEASAGLAQLGSNLKVVGGLAAGATVAGVAAIGAAALDTAGQVDAATRDIEASLGATSDRAEELGQIGLEIWGENWGGSIAEVNDAIIEVQQQFAGLGGVADNETKSMVKGAFALADTFGGEVNDYISASRTLMEQFGLSSEQALDLVTKGFQSGLNSSGDFLDTIGEYSNLFAAGGADAAQFFSLLESGLGSGVLGTDKAADAFKEFGIRIREINDDVWGPDGALRTSLGMTDQEISALYQGMQDGSVSVADAFNAIMPRLRAVDNEIYRNTIGTQLFGSQWEDLGPVMAANLDMGGTSLADMAGATDRLAVRYATWPAMLEGIRRSALVALEPISSELLNMANTAMPAVQGAIERFGISLPSALESAKQIGSQALAQIAAAAAFVESSFRAVSAAAGGVTAVALPALAAAWASVQSIIATAQGAIDGARQSLVLIGEVWAQVGQDATGPLDQIGTLINRLVDGDGTFIRIGQAAQEGFDQILAAVQPVIAAFQTDGLAGALAALPGMLTSAVGAVSELRSQLIILAADAIGGLLEQLSDSAGFQAFLANLGLSEGAAAAISSTLQSLAGIIRGGAALFVELGQQAGALVGPIAAAAASFGEMLVPHLAWFADFAETRMLPALRDLVAWLGPQFQGVISVLGPLLTGLVDIGLSVVELALMAIATTWETALKPAFQALSGWLGDLTGGWGNLARGAEALGKILGGVAQAIRDIAAGKVDFGQVFSGLQNLISGDIQLPGLATGVNNFSGGLAIVGERGPELVSLPGGSNVIPSGPTRGLLGEGGGGTPIIINVAGNVISERDLVEVVRRGLIENGRRTGSALGGYG